MPTLCTICRKTVHPDMQSASDAARKITRRHPRHFIGAYKCPGGNGFHVGHKLGSGRLTRAARRISDADWIDCFD